MATRIERFLWSDSRLESAQPEAGADWSWSTDEVYPDSTSESTCTLIQTANSSYLFLMTAPSERLGLLVGGALGECPASAILVGAMPGAAGISESQPCLRTGSRAVFDIASDGGYKRLVTSPVVNLVHAQVPSGDAPAHRQ
jgi:hypothetical protein